MSNGAGKPKPAFFIAVAVVVAGLIALAVMRCKGKSESGGGSGSQVTDNGGGSNGKQVPAENPGDGVTSSKRLSVWRMRTRPCDSELSESNSCAVSFTRSLPPLPFGMSRYCRRPPLMRFEPALAGMMDCAAPP